MRKWKPFCHLRKRLKALLKNETGVTLVELLAAIAILGIVIALAGSIHIFGQRQFRSQTESAGQANDLSHALTVMSTDLRRYSPDQVQVTAKNVIEISNSDGDFVPTYMQSGTQLMQGDAVLIDYISEFIAEDVYDEVNANIVGVDISIIVKSASPGVEAKTYQTKIYFRGAQPPEATAATDGGG